MPGSSPAGMWEIYRLLVSMALTLYMIHIPGGVKVCLDFCWCTNARKNGSVPELNARLFFSTNREAVTKSFDRLGDAIICNLCQRLGFHSSWYAIRSASSISKSSKSIGRVNETWSFGCVCMFKGMSLLWKAMQFTLPRPFASCSILLAEWAGSGALTQ